MKNEVTSTSSAPSKSNALTTFSSQQSHYANYLASFVELISSMRFAISLLSLIAIASIIGTVLKQNEPMPNYVNQFGPFWFEVFRQLSLYSVYTSWWFLLILAFLVLSTTLCLVRNTPKMLKDMRSWRLNVREQSLHNFAHKVEWESDLERTDVARQLTLYLQQCGYQIKQVEKENATLLAGKCGAANKLGYIFAHSAIVIILLGGLLDSDLSIRAEEWFMGKVPFEGNGMISQVEDKHRLSLNNPTFRGNTLISEGQVSNSAIIPQANGVFIQDLPFSILLKKFNIEFYSTGMPKLFVSEVEVQDHDTGRTFPATIKVNEPLIYKGIAVYQSSFEDGGSKLELMAYPMTGDESNAFKMQGEVGGSTPLVMPTHLASENDQMNIEWSGFRPFNVENIKANTNAQDESNDVRSVKKPKSINQQIASNLDQHLGSAAKGVNAKELKNIGASIQYKLRDKNGQAREYTSYMQSIKMDNAWVFLTGVRESPSEPFRYLRIPADDQDSLQDWMRFRAALHNPTWRSKAAARYAQTAFSDGNKQHSEVNDQMRSQLQLSAEKSLSIFAGNERAAGYGAVSEFLEKIPVAEQEKAASVFMKILNGSLWNCWQIARHEAGLPEADLNEKNAQFLQLASIAYSDAFFYKAPVYLQLASYDEVKASVFQVTRSPGKNVVYFGCILLVLGLFSMFYVRNQRVWVWLKDVAMYADSQKKTHAILALSAQRKTMDFDKEFAKIKDDCTFRH